MMRMMNRHFYLQSRVHNLFYVLLNTNFDIHQLKMRLLQWKSSETWKFSAYFLVIKKIVLPVILPTVLNKRKTKLNILIWIKDKQHLFNFNDCVGIIIIDWIISSWRNAIWAFKNSNVTKATINLSSYFLSKQ